MKDLLTSGCAVAFIRLALLAGAFIAVALYEVHPILGIAAFIILAIAVYQSFKRR